MVWYRYITIPNTLFRDNPRPPLLCSFSVPFFHFFCGFIPNAVNDAAHRGRSAASAAVYWRGGAWCDVLWDVLVRQLKEKLATSSRNMNCALSQSWILDLNLCHSTLSSISTQQHAVSATLCPIAKATSESPSADSSEAVSTPLIPPSQEWTSSISAKLHASAAVSAAIAVSSADVRLNHWTPI